MKKVKTAYDFDDKDFILIDGKNGIDSQGHIMQKIDDITAYDWNTGKFHYVNDWDDKEDINKKKKK